MTPAPKNRQPNWAKRISIIGGILGVMWVGYQLGSKIYSDVQANKKAIIEQAKADALRQADRNAYRLRVEQRFEATEKHIAEQDSVTKDLKKQLHIKN